MPLPSLLCWDIVFHIDPFVLNPSCLYLTPMCIEHIKDFSFLMVITLWGSEWLWFLPFLIFIVDHMLYIFRLKGRKQKGNFNIESSLTTHGQLLSKSGHFQISTALNFVLNESSLRLITLMNILTLSSSKHGVLWSHDLSKNVIIEV